MYWFILLLSLTFASIQEGPDILGAASDGSTPIAPAYSATTDGPSPMSH